jgi:hypothetical protein
MNHEAGRCVVAPASRRRFSYALAQHYKTRRWDAGATKAVRSLECENAENLASEF